MQSGVLHDLLKAFLRIEGGSLHGVKRVERSRRFAIIEMRLRHVSARDQYSIQCRNHKNPFKVLMWCSRGLPVIVALVLASYFFILNIGSQIIAHFASLAIDSEWQNQNSNT